MIRNNKKISNGVNIKENVSLAEHTTFKIGGKARYFVLADNKEDIIEAIRFSKEKNISFFILGQGANTLALDEGYKGLVIKVQGSKFQVQDSEIIAEAGALLKDLVDLSVKASLSGLEWAAGIPGTIGGAVYGNAKAFEGKTEDNVKEVELLDIETGKIKKINNKECQFTEKNSIFKKNKNLIILSVVLKLKKGYKEEIEKVIEDRISLRKERHPLDFPSAGSVFVNKVGKKPSSYLIEKAGLKGKKVGGAKVSEKHAGFIVNTGGASSKDVLELIKIVKKQVKDKFNVSLKEEIQIIK